MNGQKANKKKTKRKKKSLKDLKGRNRFVYKISSPGNQVTETVAYTQQLQKHEFPANQFNKEDYDKRFKFDRRLQDQYDSMKIWK